MVALLQPPFGKKPNLEGKSVASKLPDVSDLKSGQTVEVNLYS